METIFSDTTQWWDNRWTKPSPQHPDFQHKESKAALLSNNPHKPAWVDSRLAPFDTGLKTTPVSGNSKIRRHGHEDHLEARLCRKLCVDGQISAAVDALERLVQRGCFVPNNLFYRALKRCIEEKDLALGRRIHTLSGRSGYEGNAFLATHLIGLYASHGRLEEAMRVFTKVSTPDAYNWATIIFAYARHGEAAEAAEAIHLYRQMCESNTVQPDNRIYAAVLKACARAGDLVAGKEVHAHILARPGMADIFVQTGLVNMYAKCGSLIDARSVLEKLPERNIVAYNALLSGYVQYGMGREALSLHRSLHQDDLYRPTSITYLCLLQACAIVGVRALDEGKQLHAHIEERGLQQDVVLRGSLVNMYAKCGSLEDARIMFDKLSGRDVVIWTAMIAGYAQQGRGHEALSLYRTMQQECLTPPDSVTYVCLLQACASVGVQALHEGKKLHAQIKKRGLQEDVVLSGSLVNMYAKCGSLDDARILFDKLPDKDIVKWTAMIAGYAKHGMGREALCLYRGMQHEGLAPPDSVTYVCLLQACASVGVGALNDGKQLHAQIKDRGLQGDVVVGGSLVNMYAKCANLEDARRVFEKLPERNIVACNAMLAGYAQQGMGQEALSLYRRMQLQDLNAPNRVTYVCLLQACASVGLGALHEGKQLHAQIKLKGLHEEGVLGVSLVNMYAKCGSLEDAQALFIKLPERNVVAWNALIAGYVQQGMGHEALTLYKSMQQEALTLPDCVTYGCLLQACASVGIGALYEGKQLHTHITQGLQNEGGLGVSLVNMYVKCGSLDDARRVFDNLPERTVLSWNAMISGYTQHGMGQDALGLYSSMQHEGLTPDSVTYVCLLQACASVGVGALDVGKQLDAEINEQKLQEDVVLGGGLVNMYVKCGCLGNARIVFDTLSDRDVVTWTAMIAGYAQQGMGQEALSLYSSMKQEGLSPNSVTYVCLLQACSAVPALPLGEQLHAEIVERGLQADGVVGPALINMYAKCGSMSSSQRVFDSLSNRGVEVWGALVSGYASHGDSQVVFDLLDRMKLEGVHPNEITFLSVLTVCSHGGLVDKGREYFEAMRTDYGITATVEHFRCMVDLLGRAGHLHEALHMVKTMPFPPNEVVWHTLLGACRKWKNVKIAEQAFKGAVTVDERDAASYVLMSSIYSSVRMFKAAKEMQTRRKKLGAWKKPGQSQWTDMDGVAHRFLVRDRKHPGSKDIYARLEQLVPKMKDGHVPPMQSSFLVVRTDEKEVELFGHGENVAAANALNKQVNPQP